jgi:hypothetical protein
MYIYNLIALCSPLSEPKFCRNVPTPSSGLKISQARNQHEASGRAE